jgi:hypothetical protein
VGAERERAQRRVIARARAEAPVPVEDLYPTLLERGGPERHDDDDDAHGRGEARLAGPPPPTLRFDHR